MPSRSHDSYSQSQHSEEELIIVGGLADPDVISVQDCGKGPPKVPPKRPVANPPDDPDPPSDPLGAVEELCAREKHHFKDVVVLDDQGNQL